ncbi:angio-associated migratory cell protein isoform X3 [Frankliniella occidentalis]|nr:angio-associated migratory cell protein isoform X3 [Frankliniella occidentalis]XP_052125865.1 angio-associated migratory cell protein isoform X3 [Frankliniella occidentalis]XP_052125866.1 angio-associated migratory cell protein isoform X3 [Frankliniella occidentalis]
MPKSDTPPSSPHYPQMDDDEDEEEFFEVNEDELEEVLNLADGGRSDEEDEAFDDEPVLGPPPERDDAFLLFSQHSSSIFSCHIEPTNGKLAVTGGQDDKAYVWEIENGKILLECTGHQDSVTAVEFSQDGNYVATADMAGLVQVWRTSSMQKVWEYTMGDMTWMRWHHGTNVLMAGAASSEVYMWKIPSGDCKVFGGSGEKSDCGVILPDGKRACVGYSDGTLKLLDLKAGSIVKSMSSDEAGTISDIAAHHDNNLILAGINGKAFVASCNQGKVLSTLHTQVPGGTEEQNVEAVAISPDASLPLAAYGTLEGYLFIWDLAHQAQRHIVHQQGAITKIMWDQERPSVYTSGTDGVLRHFDVRSGVLVQEWLGHRADILDFSRSRDGRYLLTASDDKTSRIFKLD